jgi:MerR family transcriptional regulator, heat shock protein HspR
MSDLAAREEHVPLADAARRVRIPVARVRRYVRVGLIQPARVEGRRMLFREADLARLRKVRRLSDGLGINAEGIEVVLRLLDEIDALRAALAQRRGPGG